MTKDIKVVKLNADYGNNVKGDVCSFPAHIADMLCEQKIKTGEGPKPGAVFLANETKAAKKYDEDLAVYKEIAEADAKASLAAAQAAYKRGS